MPQAVLSVCVALLLLTVAPRAFGVAQDTPRRTQARARLQTVLKALRASDADLARAETELADIAGMDATFAAPWYNLALVQENRNEIPAATASLEKCLRAEPEGTLAMESKLRLALLKAAAKGEGPNVEDRQAALVAAMREAGQVADGIVAAEQFLAKNPGSWRLNGLYGELLAANEQYDKAKTAFLASARAAPAALKPRLEEKARRTEYVVYAQQEETAALAAGREKAPEALNKLYHAWQLNPRNVTLSLLTAAAALAKNNEPIALEVSTELARTGPPGARADALGVIRSVRALDRLSERVKVGPQQGKVDGIPELEVLKEEGADPSVDLPERELPKQSRQDALTEARASLQVAQERERRATEMQTRWNNTGQEIAAHGGDPSYAAERIASYRSLLLAEKRRQMYLRLFIAYQSSDSRPK